MYENVRVPPWVLIEQASSLVKSVKLKINFRIFQPFVEGTQKKSKGYADRAGL